ncbi:MAG: hypothetical protein JJE40_19280 [Vicinamibacteria bacterium]|nr:hypothetical protein [Vicinamibacteria bacterium]
MRNTIVTVCGACVIASLTGMAQTPAPAPLPTASASKSTERPETSLTLVGCLKYWDGATDASAGANSTPASRPAGPSAKYMISNVESRNQSGGVPAASYALMGDSKVNLAGHVNHKVQVSGTIAADSDGNPSESAGRPSPSATGPASLRTLNVISLKMISEPCP